MNPSRLVSSSNAGHVTVFIGITIAVLIGFVALSIDTGHALFEQRRAQQIADAAAFAAVSRLPASATLVQGEAQGIGTNNGLVSSELPASAVECGYWNASTRNFTVGTCTASSSNAVRVTTNRIVTSKFGKIFGIASMHPTGVSIASRSGSNCIKPFGIEQSGIPNTLVPGNIFTVGNNAPANWGKLDIGGNMSNGNYFRDAMASQVCHSDASVGEDVSSGTGFGGSIENAFNGIPTDQRSGMIFAVTTDFPNGNHDVTILSFIKVDFVSQSGSGNGWEGTFRLVEYPTIPPTGGTTGGRSTVD